MISPSGSHWHSLNLLGIVRTNLKSFYKFWVGVQVYVASILSKLVTELNRKDSTIPENSQKRPDSTESFGDVAIKKMDKWESIQYTWWPLTRPLSRLRSTGTLLYDDAVQFRSARPLSDGWHGSSIIYPLNALLEQDHSSQGFDEPFVNDSVAHSEWRRSLWH